MVAYDVQPYRRYRITLLHDVDILEDWSDDDRDVEMPSELSSGILRYQVRKTSTRAGTAYEGIASSIDADGFFDIRLDTGEVLGIYAGDESLEKYGSRTVALFRKDHSCILGVCLAKLSVPAGGHRQHRRTE